MPLPDNFSPWEHLQSTLIFTYNREVFQEFRDINSGAEEDDINTPRASLRTACMIRDDDSAVMCAIRMMLFYFSLRKAQDLQTPIYGIPTPSFQEARKFKPQVQLSFQEDHRDIEPGYTPVTGEISFRLMSESSQTLTESEARVIANKVKTLFGGQSAFVWRKGKVMCSYTDRAKGYQLQLLCRDKSEGKRVIEQVLDIQNHSPDWKFLNVSENENAVGRYPTIPPRETVLGRSRRMPRSRPIADVRFQYAVMHVHGISNPVVLYDRSRIFRQQLAD